MGNERVVYSTKLNWTLYIKSLTVILIGLILFIDSSHSINGCILSGLGEQIENLSFVR
jgi:hypothetical protein